MTGPSRPPRVQGLSPQRTFVYHLQRRAQRHHCPISVSARLDITDTLARIERSRDAGRRIGLVALFIKATACALERHPRLNQRLFHGLLGRPKVATFDEISCNTVVARPRGRGEEELLVPMVLRNVNAMSVDDIQGEIRRYKSAPREEIEPLARLNRIATLPRWLIRLLHWRFARDPKYLIAHVGTYGVSALPHRGAAITSTFTPTTQTTFFPTSIQDHVAVVDGRPQVRTMLLCTVTADHHLVDGLDLQRMSLDFKAMLEDPDRLLGPEGGSGG